MALLVLVPSAIPLAPNTIPVPTGGQGTIMMAPQKVQQTAPHIAQCIRLSCVHGTQ